MQVLIVTFNLKGLSDADYRPHAESVAPAFAGIPGLIAKVWLADAGSGTYGGVYLFEDRASVDAYLASNLVASMRANPAIAGLEVRVLDTVEAATAVTQGRLDLVRSHSAV